MRHLTCDPDVKVVGGNILSVLQNVNAKEIHPYAVKHELGDVKADEWYPLTQWLDMMNDLIENTYFMSNLVAIGMSLAEKVNLPPHMQDATYEDILLAWDDIYHHQHQGDNIGNHHIEKISDTQFKCTFTDVYPDDLKYGIAYGFARRFLPKGTQIIIEYDDLNNRMDEGSSPETVMHISWN